MGPIRSLYEQEGDLERALLQPPGGAPVMLRPVEMSDCGKRHECLGFYQAWNRAACLMRSTKSRSVKDAVHKQKSRRLRFRKQRQRTQLSWAVRRR